MIDLVNLPEPKRRERAYRGDFMNAVLRLQVTNFLLSGGVANLALNTLVQGASNASASEASKVPVLQ